MSARFLVITFTGEDRPGIVASLAAVVREHGGNWEASRMASLAGRFAGILQVRVDALGADGLVAALRAVPGLSIVVDRGVEVAPRWRRLRLALTGQDRPGIVREIAQALADRGVNIEDMLTRTVEAPMSGEVLFEAIAEVTAPETVHRQDLCAALERIAADLMVDITLHDPVEGEIPPR